MNASLGTPPGLSPGPDSGYGPSGAQRALERTTWTKAAK